MKTRTSLKSTIWAVLAAAGAAAALSFGMAQAAYTPWDPQIAGQLPATATNDNAAAGYVGEVITATVASASAASLTTAMTSNVTSVSLTPGDWDCRGVVDYPLVSVTISLFQVGTSTSSAAVGAQDSFISLPLASVGLTSTMGIMVPVTRYSLASMTSVYLVANATFSLGTAKAYGTLICRRVR